MCTCVFFTCKKKQCVSKVENGNQMEDIEAQKNNNKINIELPNEWGHCLEPSQVSALSVPFHWSKHMIQKFSVILYRE